MFLDFYFMFDVAVITSKHLLTMEYLVYGMIMSFVVLGEEEQGLYTEGEKKYDKRRSI